MSLYAPYRYALEVGGKRIRPFLGILAAGMYGGTIEAAMPAALAVEILHNFTLVHDDIMDCAETRRGKPSVFKKWNENTAILSGDEMFAGAMEQLNYYGKSEEYSKQEYFALNQCFLSAITEVCEGQALDMEFVERQRVSLEEYIQMITGKTAALLAASLKMGAITAHANEQQQQHLAELGKEMGIAFQIQDDYMDATANPEKFGKKPRGDIFEGKKTYLTILALERANELQQKTIMNTLNSTKPSEQEVSLVLSIMEELKVFDDTAREINRRYQNVFSMMDSFPESIYKKELENLLIFLQNRDH